MYDVIIIGGGITGASVGKALYERFPGAKILIIEKETSLAAHQTGHNSGVIHSGIYYKPGSYKAAFARNGSRSMTEFCREHDIEHDICGKVIVAAEPKELPLLDNLYDRGKQNGLAVEKIDACRLKETEPHVNGIAAISVPAAGIVNFTHVTEAFASIFQKNGGVITFGEKVEQITETGEGVVVETEAGTHRGAVMINCAGLHSDKVARLAGYHADLKIVPFRGEYFKLKPGNRSLVKNLVYPVPNPDFPFLGVHFTRMIDGEVEAGPNAVLSFKREGYRKSDFSIEDFSEVMMYPGFWKLARKYMKEGSEEMLRSFSKKMFVKSLQRLIPEITADDLEAGPSGVRAQALKSDGVLVDDFYIINGKRSIHVCNAPSPAATASIEIGNYVAGIAERKMG